MVPTRRYSPHLNNPGLRCPEMEKGHHQNPRAPSRLPEIRQGVPRQMEQRPQPRYATVQVEPPGGRLRIRGT